MGTPGIYKITNLVDGKVYVGSSNNIERRFVEHINRLRAGKHHSPYLQHAWHKYGESAFEFSVLEVVSPSVTRIEREQFWIDSCCSANKRFGYNVCPAAGTVEGIKRSAETLEKMSAAAVKRHQKYGSPTLGRKHSSSTKDRIGASNRGRKHSAETRAKVSAAAKKRSQDGRNSFAGKSHSEATRAKMRAAWERRKLNGLSHAHSAETRAKISASLKGRSVSEETKAKLRAAALGHRAAGKEA
ncbi:NUMOD3 domain-containing DNA-binding protein [Burkholderia cenocepacia]|uniref:NUMOD3 domain-containing DNA-binding protein n=1 Tax=Burkholderia cenocepacia TaxID=95486 RepID=UPI001CF3B1B7|nr:NUMOD3 domain-containing DNA-binding protein [Burkholderia cenocepacia]MCA8237748.1 GIY-YIG nuclease family protein [Burkholderia cenocepacia]